MAHFSDALASDTQGLSSLWGLWGEIDMTQWQWQAPKQRLTGDRNVPSASLSWDVPLEAALELQRTVNQTAKPEETLSVFDEIVLFQKRLQLSSPDGISKICQEFKQLFSQNLSLGVVPGATIVFGLETFTKSLRSVCSDTSQENAECLSFYQAVWQGMAACKVLSPADFDPSVLRSFLDGLSRLPSTLGVQTLALSTVQSASYEQLSKTKASVCRLVLRWMQALPYEHAFQSSDSCLLEAEQAASHAESKVLEAYRLLETKENGSSAMQDADGLQSSINRAKLAINFGIEAVVKSEQVVIPYKAAIASLAKLLESLPHKLMMSVVHIVSKYLSKLDPRIYTKKDPASNPLYCWLSVVVQLPWVPHELFVETWKKTKAEIMIHNESLSTDLVLSAWIKDCRFTNPALVKITFEASASRVGDSDLDFGTLLFAIDKTRELCWNRTASLFQLLYSLGRHRMVYRILRQMRRIGLKVPHPVFVSTINSVTKYDTLLALRIYKLYDTMRAYERPLGLEQCPKLVISMINHPGITSDELWQTLGIPVYERMSARFRKQFDPRMLSSDSVELLTKMAVAFARNELDRPRIALRNVMNCIHHLRRHNAPLSADITRALTHAGITRHIIHKEHVSRDRVQWALGLIEAAEGTEVAETVDTIVSLKNSMYHGERLKKQEQERRERNVLHVGPID